MFGNNAVADHYSHGQLTDAIRAGVREMGNTPGTITVDDLAAVDEFHIGGRTASVDLLGQLGISSAHHVLDVGCGIGGTARFLASTSGCKVSGIDLTPEYIETGQVLCSWVGLAERIDLHCGSALAMPFEASHFDAAVMLHVGMNIEDKADLFAEVNRVLRPGGVFGIYDIMRQNDDPLVYPVPWATVRDTSTLGTPQDYREALNESGFEITTERDRRDFATEFFARLRKRIEAAGGAAAPWPTYPVWRHCGHQDPEHGGQCHRRSGFTGGDGRAEAMSKSSGSRFINTAWVPPRRSSSEAMFISKNTRFVPGSRRA